MRHSWSPAKATRPRYRRPGRCPCGAVLFYRKAERGTGEEMVVRILTAFWGAVDAINPVPMPPCPRTR